MSTSLTSSSDPDAFCRILASSKSLGILTGAGLSAASGIETYRGVDGQWNHTNPFEVASLRAWNENPDRVWTYSHSRRDACLRASPNAAHDALATLSLLSTRKRLLPSLTDPSKPPLYITQNIDGLCRRAIDSIMKTPEAEEMDADEKKLVHERHIEMHGSMYRVVCTQCKCIKWTEENPLAPIFANDTSTRGDEKIPIDQLPRCGGSSWSGSNRYGRCGGLLRPGVVWFGEVPENQGEIIRHLTKVDVLLVIGTSSLVHPAASYAGTVKKNGGTVAVCNLGPTQIDDHADFVFHGPCEKTIPMLFKRLGQINDAQASA
ncbi:sirtuin [Macrolepiota fuliginosa MF-IS2]|uniref:Sirtuin n=1 Tax=Macrolepiota fuliginosa MF-IS2 TaxID=1400762 RepID=A0A9P6C737_9AGAR|nr:sirtuin [Macrolepiota fuliginosa MF-IS2]